MTDAEVSLSTFRDKIGSEARLIALRIAFDDLLREVKQRQAEQLARESDRNRYREFLRRRDDAMVYDTRYTGLDLSTDRAATRGAARAALDLYAAGATGDSWTLRSMPSSLTELEWSEVVEACYGLLMMLADAEPQPEQGLLRLDEAGRLRPPTRAYHLRRADCLTRAGDKPAADRERRAADGLKPSTAFDHFLAGQERFARKDFLEASKEFDAALQLQPDRFWAQALSAVCSLQLGQPDEAKAHLNACLRREQGFAWLYILRGLASGQIAGIARDVMPKHPSQGERVDRLYAAADSDYRRAQVLLDRSSDTDLRYSLLVDRGVLRLTLGRDLDEAVEQLRAAIRLNPRSWEAHDALAKVFQIQHRPDEAVEQYGRAIAVSPRSARLYRDRAKVELGRVGPTEAHAWLARR